MSKIKSKYINTSRGLAVYVIEHTYNHIPLQQALDTALFKFRLNDKETALCTELVYGYCRYYIRINFILDKLLQNRKKLPSILQITLGISVYALLFLEKVPHYATVDWAVNFIKNQFGLGFSKLCNGVLRNIIRLENTPHEEHFYAFKHQFYSIPKWIYELWINSYGEDVANSLSFRSLQRPKICIRLNNQNTHYEDFSNFLIEQSIADPIGFSGFVFSSQKLPIEIHGKTLPELHADGAFSWQAAGSQIAIAKCFSAYPNLIHHKWWDACSGQGGKSMLLTEQNIKVLLASDVSKERMKVFKANFNRLKIELPHLVQMSAAEPALSNYRHSILLDVPCSGLGTLSRRPDIRFNRLQSDLLQLEELQQSILQQAFNILVKGSFIIYLTCTLNPAENEVQVEKLLKNNCTANLLYSWQTPHEHPWLEGMYVALIQKI